MFFFLMEGKYNTIEKTKLFASFFLCFKFDSFFKNSRFFPRRKRVFYSSAESFFSICRERRPGKVFAVSLGKLRESTAHEKLFERQIICVKTLFPPFSILAFFPKRQDFLYSEKSANSFQTAQKFWSLEKSKKLED